MNIEEFAKEKIGDMFGCEYDSTDTEMRMCYDAIRVGYDFCKRGEKARDNKEVFCRGTESGEPIKIKAVGGRVEMYVVVFTDGVSSLVKSMHTDYKEAVDSALKYKRKCEENGNDHYGDYWWLKIVKQDENGKIGQYVVNADGSVEKK